MFHCVIPQSRNIEPPVRIYAPNRSLTGFRKLVKAQSINSQERIATGVGSPTRRRSFVKATSPRSLARIRRSKRVLSTFSNITHKPAKVIKAKPVETEPQPAEEEPAPHDPFKKWHHLFRRRSCSLDDLLRISFRCIPRLRITREVRREAGRILARVAREYRIQKSSDKNVAQLASQPSFQTAFRNQLLKALLRTLCRIEFDRNWDGHDAVDLERQITESNAYWHAQLRKGLEGLFVSISGKVSKLRSSEEMEYIWNKWNGLDILIENETRLDKVLVVYTVKDLTKRVMDFPLMPFEVKDRRPSRDFWLTCGLATPTFEDLRHLYVHFSPLYDNHQPDYFEGEYLLLQQARELHMERALARGDLLQVRKLCRLSCCTTNREVAWSKLLRDRAEEGWLFEEIVTDFVQREFASDWYMLKSVKQVVGNCDLYFNFLPIIHQVTQMFQRDFTVADHLMQTMDTQLWDGRGKNPAPFTSNGMITFHEFPMYAAPLVYVSLQADALYFTFRQLYVRYFQHLHTFSTHPQGILCLYALFEQLLYAKEPELWHHLRVKLDFHPGEYVVPWLSMAFSGFLDIDQILYLWDRIIGYNDLRILSLLSLGIFLIRKNALMKAKTIRDLSAMLCDIFHTDIVTLLQMVLVMT